MIPRKPIELYNQIIKEYLEGKNQNFLERKYKISRETIRKHLKIRGIDIRPTFQRKVKHNPFEDLTNPEVQYWLGWIITDGNIYKSRISLNSTGKDIDVLENYCNFLKIPISNIQRIKLKNPNHDDKCCVRFCNRGVSNYLKNLGIDERKSLTINPKIVLTPNLVRGLIEGDGSLNINRNSATVNFVTGSSFLSEKYVFFLNNNGIIFNLHKNKNCFVINVTGRRTLLLLNIIYPENCFPFGKRKYEKAIKILNLYP